MSVAADAAGGWNFRNEKIGGTQQQFALMGGYVPFASTKAEPGRDDDEAERDDR